MPLARLRCRLVLRGLHPDLPSTNPTCTMNTAGSVHHGCRQVMDQPTLSLPRTGHRCAQATATVANLTQNPTPGASGHAPGPDPHSPGLTFLSQPRTGHRHGYQHPQPDPRQRCNHDPQLTPGTGDAPAVRDAFCDGRPCIPSNSSHKANGWPQIVFAGNLAR